MDLATPFFAAIYEARPLPIADSLRNNIQSTFYDSAIWLRTRAGFEEAARRHSWLHPQRQRGAEVLLKLCSALGTPPDETATAVG